MLWATPPKDGRAQEGRGVPGQVGSSLRRKLPSSSSSRISSRLDVPEAELGPKGGQSGGEPAFPVDPGTRRMTVKVVATVFKLSCP